MGKKSKEANKKGKKQRTGKKHSSVTVNALYQINGDNAERKKKACPRCGQGTWLGEHKGRSYCGKCGYTEFHRGASQEEKPAEVKEQPKEEVKTEEKVEEKPAETNEQAKEEAPKESEEKPEEKKE